MEQELFKPEVVEALELSEVLRRVDLIENTAQTAVSGMCSSWARRDHKEHGVCETEFRSALSELTTLSKELLTQRSSVPEKSPTSPIYVRAVTLAYEQGFGQCRSGHPNPYPEGSETHVAWDQGAREGNNRVRQILELDRNLIRRVLTENGFTTRPQPGTYDLDLNPYVYTAVRRLVVEVLLGASDLPVSPEASSQPGPTVNKR